MKEKQKPPSKSFTGLTREPSFRSTLVPRDQPSEDSERNTLGHTLSRKLLLLRKPQKPLLLT